MAIKQECWGGGATLKTLNPLTIALTNSRFLIENFLHLSIKFGIIVLGPLATILYLDTAVESPSVAIANESSFRLKIKNIKYLQHEQPTKPFSKKVIT